MVRMHLAAKRVLSEYKLTREAFMWLLGEIEQRFYLAQSHSGDCVGTVAAQSLGEPTTQVGASGGCEKWMTLHVAVGSGRGFTVHGGLAAVPVQLQLSSCTQG